MEAFNRQCRRSLSFQLLTKDGALLAYSGFDAKDAKIIAAMASSIFAAHQRVRQTSTSTLPQNYVGSGDLNMILLDAEEGKMAISAVATQLICMVSKTNVQLGMLKAKVLNVEIRSNSKY